MMRVAVQSGLIDYKRAQETTGAVDTAKISIPRLLNSIVFLHCFTVSITI